MAFKCPPELLLRNAIRQTAASVSTTAGLQTYKAAVCTELGKPLQLQDLPRKDVGEGEVRVAIHCTGINFSDLLIIQGLYQEKPPLPFVSGAEVSGVITEVGPDVENLKVGDHVIGMVPNGGFAEELVCNAMMVWKVPADSSFAAAASLLCSYGTAWMALKRRANIQPGETVLVTAAAGGVGLAAVELATKVFGAKVIGACGGPEKCALVKRKGAVEAIDYNTESVKDRVKEITDGEGANIILDSVGGDMLLKQCLRCVAFEGRLVVIGFAGGDIPKIPANHLLLKSCTAMGVYWGSYQINAPESFLESITEVVKYLKEGIVNPHVSATFPLTKVNEAFQYIQSRKSTGKVVIRIR